MKTYHTLPSLAFWRALEARTLGEEILPRPNVDIGAADGSFAATWLDGGAQLDVGLDIKPLKTLFSERAYRRLVKGDATSLPFDSGELGGILCNSVIEHIPDDIKVVGELARVLRPGGVLLLTTPSIYFHDFLDGVHSARARGDDEAAKAYMADVDRRLHHYHYRSFDEWTSLLSDQGLRVVANAYYLPQASTAFWDRWDRWISSPILGRPRNHLLVHPKFRTLTPSLLWRVGLYPALRARYLEAIALQERPGSLGGSLYIRAIRT